MMLLGVTNNPSPGRDQHPATPGGTPNDATPPPYPTGMSPVMSYTQPNGTVVNVTLPGHPLFPGYVERSVSPDDAGNGSTVSNTGEGAGIPQSSLNPWADSINSVWISQSIANQLCGCPH